VDRAYLVGSRKAPEGFVLAEIQLEPDDDKRFAWSLYVELGRSRYRCEGALVVITVTERVRRWIQRDIVPPTGWHGSSRQLKPTVIAVDLLDPALLLRPDRPYLAPLAVAAHAKGPEARRVAEKAVDLTLAQLPKHLSDDQLDGILGLVDEALRARLESRIMRRRRYYTDFFQVPYDWGRAAGKAAGKVEGVAEGKAESILAVLAARGIPVSDAHRERILGCTDVETLDAWIQRAVVAATAAAVVRAKAAPRVAPPAPRRASRASAARRSAAAPAKRTARRDRTA
jgi:hypothetical protein